MWRLLAFALLSGCVTHGEYCAQWFQPGTAEHYSCVRDRTEAMNRASRPMIESLNAPPPTRTVCYDYGNAVECRRE